MVEESLRVSQVYRRRRRRALALAVLAVVALLVGVVAGSSAGPRRAAVPPRLSGGASSLPAVGAAARPRPSRAARARARDARAIERVRRRMPYVIGGGGRLREIALTFDDGPGPYTPKVLRILRRTHTDATFFAVGQMLHDFRGSSVAELHEGFPIEDHTENHPAMAALSPAAQETQIVDGAATLRLAGIPQPHLFRPPYRSFNAATLDLLRRQRMLMVLWNVDSRDYTRPGVQVIVQNVLSAAKRGAIVLMHDAGGLRDQTVAALPVIIAKLRRRGFKLVTVARLMRDDPPARRQPLPRTSAG